MKRSSLLDDRGNATIVATGIIAALASLTFVIATVGANRVDAHQATLAADLAAVAGAYALSYGEDGCTAARAVAEHNRAELVACNPAGADVVVTAEVDRQRAQARAGPL